VLTLSNFIQGPNYLQDAFVGPPEVHPGEQLVFVSRNNVCPQPLDRPAPLWQFFVSHTRPARPLECEPRSKGVARAAARVNVNQIPIRFDLLDTT